MKVSFFYGCFLILILSSCSRGVYAVINNKEHHYRNNIRVILTKTEGTHTSYGFQILAFQEPGNDSSVLSLSAGRKNIPISAGNYSFSNPDRINFATSSIWYKKNAKEYASAGDEVYGPALVITSLNKKRVKGWFKTLLVDIEADTTKPSNTIIVKGRFNVSLKDANHY